MLYIGTWAYKSQDVLEETVSDNCKNKLLAMRFFPPLWKHVLLAEVASALSLCAFLSFDLKLSTATGDVFVQACLYGWFTSNELDKEIL